MKTVYETQGVCSKAIVIDYDETTGTIKEAQFIGGCHGNTQGIAALVKGQNAKEVIARLKGIHCGNKASSCPDQLAIALEGIVNK